MERLLTLRTESFAHQSRPDPPRGAELCRLFKDVGPGGEEEGEARPDRVHLHAARNRRVYIRDRIGEGEGELLRCGRPRLAHVITRDADRVPLRQLGAAPFKDIGDQAHGRLWREDIRAACDVLLQHIVLCCPSERATWHPLSLSNGNVEGEQDRRGGVDRH